MQRKALTLKHQQCMVALIAIKGSTTVLDEVVVLAEANQEFNVLNVRCLGILTITFYKIIGYPSRWKSGDARRPEACKLNVNSVDTVANKYAGDGNPVQFSKEQTNQLSQLRAFFNKSGSNQPQVNHVQM